MQPSVRRVVVLAAWLTMAAAAQAQERVVTPDLILTLGQAADAQISPDGSRVVVQVNRPRTADEARGTAIPDLWMEQEEERKGRDWTVADQNDKQVRLHAIEVASEKSHVVTTGPLTVHDFDWSPDSLRLVLATADTPTVDDAFMKLKIQTVPVSGGTPALVTSTVGKLGHPRWAPDGRSIAWLGATAINDSHAGAVFVASSSGGAAENLTAGYEGSATPVRGGVPDPPDVAQSGA